MMKTKPQLDIRLLGGFSVTVDDRGIPSAEWRRKRAALLKLLAIEPNHRLHREQAMERLWPEADPAAATLSLRVALHFARQRLREAGAPPDTFLVREGESLVLGPSALVHIDVDAFEAAVARFWRTRELAVAETAANLYAGELLPDDPYEDWAADRRAALRTSYVTLLIELAAQYEHQGAFGSAIAALQQVLATDPLHEAAHAALIRLLARSGQRLEALTHYDRLTTLLEHELGTEPEATTRELVAAIRAGDLREMNQRSTPASEATSGLALRGFPAPLNELVGRERELAELRLLLGASRLVTLTGPGGVGKTRVALALAPEALASFADGACFVDLGSVRDPELVVPTIGRALGLQERGHEDLLDAVKTHLAPKRLLLVVDNFEQVAMAALTVGEVLAACPGVKIVATSRARLRLSGEQEYPLSPLALPERPLESRTPLPVEAIGQYPAVRMFVERARAARPDFVLTEGNAAAVAELCRRLDGLPLALELAAARLRVLSLPSLLPRLDRPLPLLTGGSRDAPARQQTLRAAIAWSYDLLGVAAQALFRRLAVFSGGFTLEAAEEIVSTTGPEGIDVLDGIADLVDQSLVVREEHPNEAPAAGPRFKMLDTICEFGLEQLAASGEEDEVRRAHVRFYETLAQAAAAGLTGPQQTTWLARLDVEQLNLRVALRWALPQPDSTALRLAGALWRYWDVRGQLTEGREWLERALARPAPDASAASAQALTGLLTLRLVQGDYLQAASVGEEALALWQRIGDPRGAATALDSLGHLAQAQGAYERAFALHRQALAQFQEAGDAHGAALALVNLGTVALAQGTYERAAALYAEGLTILERVGDQRGMSSALTNLGALAFLQGNYRQATERYQQALAHAQAVQDRQGIALALVNLGEADLYQGWREQAAANFAQALPLLQALDDKPNVAFVRYSLGQLARDASDNERASRLITDSAILYRQLGDHVGIAACLEALAGLSCAPGTEDRSARLLAAADGLRETIGAPLAPVYRPRLEQDLMAVRVALGDNAFAAAWQEGRTMSSDEAMAVAISAGLGGERG